MRARFFSTILLSLGMMTISMMAQAADEIPVEFDDQYTIDSVIGTELDTVVPGDSKQRTFMATNSGPSAGTIRGWIKPVDLLEETIPDAFYDEIMVTWKTESDSGEMSFRKAFENEETLILESPIAKSGSTSITVGYYFPWESTQGNFANVEKRLITFDLFLEITGEEMKTVSPTIPTEKKVNNNAAAAVPFAPEAGGASSSSSLLLLGTGIILVGMAFYMFFFIYSKKKKEKR